MRHLSSPLTTLSAFSVLATKAWIRVNNIYVYSFDETECIVNLCHQRAKYYMYANCSLDIVGNWDFCLCIPSMKLNPPFKEKNPLKPNEIKQNQYFAPKLSLWVQRHHCTLFFFQHSPLNNNLGGQYLRFAFTPFDSKAIDIIHNLVYKNIKKNKTK